LQYIKNFSFDTILSEDKKTGNLLGEYMMSYDKDYIECPSELDPILTPVLLKSVFDYPVQYWLNLVIEHPDYEYTAICEGIKQDKLYMCANLWLSLGFELPLPGSNDTLETQLYNTNKLVNMGTVERRRLLILTQRALILSGMFGKNLPTENIFNKTSTT